MGARSLALLRRFTAAPRSPASMMRWTCRSGTPVTEAASFAVMNVVGFVATLKSFHIFGKIYRFRRQFSSVLKLLGRRPELGSPGGIDLARCGSRRRCRCQVAVSCGTRGQGQLRSRFVMSPVG